MSTVPTSKRWKHLGQAVQIPLFSPLRRSPPDCLFQQISIKIASVAHGRRLLLEGRAFVHAFWKVEPPVSIQKRKRRLTPARYKIPAFTDANFKEKASLAGCVYPALDDVALIANLLSISANQQPPLICIFLVPETNSSRNRYS